MTRARTVPLVFAAAALALLGVPAAAQDAPPAPAADAPKPDGAPARAAWKAVAAATDDVRKARETKDPAKIRAAHEAARDAHARFRDAFKAAGWDAFDAAKDGEILNAGFNALLAEAVRKDRDGKRAVAVCEGYIAKIGDGQLARQIAADVMPRAHLMAGDVDRAVAAWEKAAAGEDKLLRGIALVNLGDVHAARGDLGKARASWETAAAEGAAPRFKSETAQRLALIGKPAPDIDSKDWLGGEAAPLASLRGKVVVVDFWGTWCRPCIDAMPALERLLRERKDKGLVVLGVTRWFADKPGGFLPKAGAAEPLEGAEPVQGLTAETFGPHLAQFRERIGATYPYVRTQTDAEAKTYHVYAYPTLAVIGRDGNVAFVQVGGGDDSLLRVAVDRLLAAPAGEPAPEKQ